MGLGLRLIYILLFFVIGILFLRKKKNASFLLIYFASSVLYYYNAFEGDIFVGKIYSLGVDSYPIESGSYIILIINLVIIGLFLFVERERDDYMIKSSQEGEKTVIKCFLVFVFILAAYMCIKYKVFTRESFNKKELAEESGSLATYYKYLSSFAFVVAFTQDDDTDSIMWKIIGTLPILSTFMFGNRSYLVISIVAVFFDRFYRHCFRVGMTLSVFLRKHKRIIIAAFILIFITLVVKGVSGALFRRDFDLVYSRLTSLEYYKQVFYVSEPNTIMTNLNTIVARDYRVDESSYRTLWAYFFPFITDSIEDMMGAVPFTKLYQRVLYVTTTNRASSYLGEAYANGGFLVVALVVCIYISLLLVLFRLYKACSSNIGKTMFLLAGIDGAFYIQRNCMTFQFSRFRDYFYIFVLLAIAIALVRRDHKFRI